ncbi:similar to Saccharomyces cerevisiae YGR184C UBR1 E3 ubiquitin ligase (N-recognin), forms heterodimer with Rad6p to ubiquitinate substrates in the N- end rule pathway [Maudiozyma barnettii]|uniref:E3 ubiquitin-protein ligase n=1 Tax=Maudiozyma barnettii TaxID=61262 RepID=A0A8H2VIA8_9SACH|nr:E3 ubiquitin-protein ligase UBR1 [Kazachstania barnettii]CAB4255764.1 similar to Saccharomyces cerevisiae YGR184C UBR1 E3 ubiquitin ligase (N-recognin), forms heterodimer with Rad6p to ubiquitinate substrates in the N- end rule pathway [Kazachstania barnettii]CAD1784325.1 similar to Saccharomyces cerevisiae YGR184C UBR1 E3 ubiquitin ligase (N-recognin), forms heterodimer with Rad6p to ubiquitinate substrates in the N- end rule pathway [Kazachstania barnettii]
MDLNFINNEGPSTYPGMGLFSTLRSLHNVKSFAGVRGPTERIEMDHALKRYMFKLLYFVALDNGKDIPLLFPDSKTDFKKLDELLATSSSEETDFYRMRNSQMNNKHSFKHTGRNCGRKFKVGEPLYRCHECGFDDTCVLCIHCFNAKDHENHHIYTDMCNDFTTGICDCGDEEAWNEELHCKANEKNSNDEDNKDDSKESTEDYKFNEEMIEMVLTEAFNYFLDVFNQNIESLPTFTKDITMTLRQLVQEKKIDEVKTFLEDFKYKNLYTDEGSQDQFVVMIYNDEYHNYSQATTALRQGSPDNVHTDILTSKIDSEGRAMLKCSDDVETLMAGFFAVQTNGLCATLTSWSEFIHQEACKYIIQWMAHCLTIPNSNFQLVFRDVLGKVLTGEENCLKHSEGPLPNIRQYFPNKLVQLTHSHNYLDLSILNNFNRIPQGHHKVLPESSLHSISNTLNKTEETEETDYTNSRLQLLLYFENRFWKKLRKDIQNVIIPTLASSIIYKPIFCREVVEIFNHVTRSIAYMDREPQLTALRECVVQLFTCPTNAKMIFGGDEGYFIDIVWSIIDIFMEFTKIDNGTLVWQRVQKSNPTKSYGISLKQGLYTIETLISKVDDANILLRPAEFISIVTLCKLFNGAWKIVRKEGEHVLHEDQYFIPYLEYTTSIYSIIQTMVNAFVNEGCDRHLLLNAIRLINTFLGYKSLTYKLVHGSHEIIKFSVASDRVAYMNPIHTLFSFLIENVPLVEAYETIIYQESNSALPVPSIPTSGTNNSMLQFREQYEDKVSQNFDFLKISDFSLRSVVLCSQIDVGFWVRNGMSVLHQTSYYKNNPELNTYSRDIHLNQLAFLWEIDDTPRVIYNLLDRWMLLDWFDGKVEFTETEYKDKISLIVQHFVAFIYQILTERQFFQTFESANCKKMSQIKNAIMYNLYTKPLSYSKLLRLVPDYLTENSTLFDIALNEVSIFKEPKGLADNGVFKLKEIYFSKIDPLRVSNLGNEFESSATIIKKHLDKEKKGEESKIILQPQLVSPKNMDDGAKLLGSFTRHPVFAKIIYKLLQVCLDSEDGIFLNELLHLIHGIFKDDELVNGKSSFPDAYLSKPICNLLLSILNSRTDVFSENIRTKAGYLLKRMITKRQEEVFASLIAGFGEEYVQKYKNRKLSEGVNLEENERERKKRLAKKHQAKIMAKFNNQQNKFMKENEGEFKEREKEDQVDDEGDINMPDSDKIIEAEDFTCSLCQDESSTDIFVIPSYHDYTPIFRGSKFWDVDEYMKEWNGFENDNSGFIRESDDNADQIANSTYPTRKVFVSCNHHIHYNCFKRYIQKKRFSSTAFICPLCQTFSNSVLVVHPTVKYTNGMNVSIGDDAACSTLGNSLAPLNEQEKTNLLAAYDTILTDTQYFDKLFHKSKYRSVANTAEILTINFANTISMLEISARLDKDTNSTFLVGKEQRFKTLKNLLIFIVQIYKTAGAPDLELDWISRLHSDNFMDEDPACRNELFQIIVKSCLFNKQSLSACIEEALSQYSRTFFKDYFGCPDEIEDFSKKWNHVAATYETPYVVSGNTSTYLDRLITLSEESFEGYSKVDLEHFKSLGYAKFMKLILPTLRRCFIFLKTLQLVTSEYEDNQFIVNNINIETSLIPKDGLSLKDTVDRMVSILTTCEKLDDLMDVKNPSEQLENKYKHVSDECCSVIKLVNLSKYLNTYVTDTNAILLKEENKRSRNSSNRLDFKICLTCGAKIHLRTDRHEISKHLSQNCFKPFGAFLIPNSSEVCLQLSQPPSSIYISAPYLNSHGEAGRNAMKRGDLTTLNQTRYEHLNKLWINNEIPGYISRVMGDEFRVSILSNGFLFALNRDPATRRRVPPTNEGDDSDEEQFGGNGNDFFTDEDMDEDDRFRNMNGQPGDVRDFFQIFQTVRNAMDNGENVGEDVDLTTPFLQLFGQQFRGADPNNDNDGSDGEGPFRDNNDDDDEDEDADDGNAW